MEEVLMMHDLKMTIYTLTKEKEIIPREIKIPKEYVKFLYTNRKWRGCYKYYSYLEDSPDHENWNGLRDNIMKIYERDRW